MTDQPAEQAARPSDEAFALIEACMRDHFSEGLCAECVDALLTRERVAQKFLEGAVEKARREERERAEKIMWTEIGREQMVEALRRDPAGDPPISEARQRVNEKTRRMDPYAGDAGQGVDGC